MSDSLTDGASICALTAATAENTGALRSDAGRPGAPASSAYPGAPPPFAYSLSDAAQALGIKKTTLYHLLSEGALDARKIGGRTVVTAQSLHAFVAGLPRADINLAPRRTAA